MASNIKIVDGHPVFVEGADDAFISHALTGDLVWEPTSDAAVTPETVDVFWWNAEAGEWQAVVEDVGLGAAVTHTTPYLAENRYKAVTHTSLPSSAEGPELVQVVNEQIWHYINSGDGFGDVVRAAGNPAREESPMLAKEVVQPSGATWPMVLRGKARSNQVTQDLRITPDASQEPEWRDLAYKDSSICLRTPIRRVIGELTALKFSDGGRGVYDVSLTVQQTGV